MEPKPFPLLTHPPVREPGMHKMVGRGTARAADSKYPKRHSQNHRINEVGKDL